MISRISLKKALDIVLGIDHCPVENILCLTAVNTLLFIMTECLNFIDINFFSFKLQVEYWIESTNFYEYILFSFNMFYFICKEEYFPQRLTFSPDLTIYSLCKCTLPHNWFGLCRMFWHCVWIFWGSQGSCNTLPCRLTSWNKIFQYMRSGQIMYLHMWHSQNHKCCKLPKIFRNYTLRSNLCTRFLKTMMWCAFQFMFHVLLLMIWNLIIVSKNKKLRDLLQASSSQGRSFCKKVVHISEIFARISIP